MALNLSGLGPFIPQGYTANGQIKPSDTKTFLEKHGLNLATVRKDMFNTLKSISGITENDAIVALATHECFAGIDAYNPYKIYDIFNLPSTSFRYGIHYGIAKSPINTTVSQANNIASFVDDKSNKPIVESNNLNVIKRDINLQMKEYGKKVKGVFDIAKSKKSSIDGRYGAFVIFNSVGLYGNPAPAMYKQSYNWSKNLGNCFDKLLGDVKNTITPSNAGSADIGGDAALATPYSVNCITGAASSTSSTSGDNNVGQLLAYNGDWGELTAVGQNIIRQASTHIMMYGSMKGRKIGYKGERCCTSGPGGWYTAGGIPFYWGWYRRNGKGTPVTDCNLAAQGFKKIWEGKMGKGNPPVKYFPTDVVAIYTTQSDHQHGVIWTGAEWLSDYIQPIAMCGSYYASIETYSQLWRHPKCWTKPPTT